MQARQLRLVLPSRLHATYRPEQRALLMRLDAFLTLVKERQANIRS